MAINSILCFRCEEAESVFNMEQRYDLCNRVYPGIAEPPTQAYDVTDSRQWDFGISGAGRPQPWTPEYEVNVEHFGFGTLAKLYAGPRNHVQVRQLCVIKGENGESKVKERAR